MFDQPLTENSILAAHLFRSPVTAALRQEAETFPSDSWMHHVNRRDYQGDWSVLPLRCLDEHRNSHPILQGFDHAGRGTWQDLDSLTRSPHLVQLLDLLKCPKKSVRLMKLAAGGQILPHRDPGLSLEYGEARLHYALVTDPRVTFLIGGQMVPMREGEFWYMNADAKHSVRNHSDFDRVHLVVDCEVNDWLRDAIQNASAVVWNVSSLQDSLA